MSVDKKLEKINELKSTLDQVKTKKPWDRHFLEQIKLNFTHFSNKIEGNSLEYGQTIRLLRDLVVPEHASPGDMLDMIHHKELLDIVFQNFYGLSISEESIKKCHASLMKDRFQWADDGLFSPGQYKSFDNFTYRQNGTAHHYVSYKSVPKEMASLIESVNYMLNNVNVLDKTYHPITIATFFHQRFLNEIHPFSDGNGRIGRLFMNIILMKCGFSPIFIKEVDRGQYFQTFELSESDEGAMIDFMADKLLESMEYEIAATSENR